MVSWFDKIVNRFKKAKITTTTKIVLGAATTVSAISLFLLFTAIGVQITSSGDIICGNTCYSEIYLSNWTKDFTVGNLDDLVLDFTPDPESYDLLFPTTNGYKSYRSLSSFTFKAGQTYKLILTAKKKPTETIKWTFKAAGAELDPVWQGVNPIPDAPNGVVMNPDGGIAYAPYYKTCNKQECSVVIASEGFVNDSGKFLPVSEYDGSLLGILPISLKSSDSTFDIIFNDVDKKSINVTLIINDIITYNSSTNTSSNTSLIGQSIPFVIFNDDGTNKIGRAHV